MTTTSASGFVAGTLVHTIDGLRPIEQIQVGDWVLSKPESGEGDRACTQVTRTLAFPGQRVKLLQFELEDREESPDILVVTGGHLFRESAFRSRKSSQPIAFNEWTMAAELKSGSILELIDGAYLAAIGTREVKVLESQRLWVEIGGDGLGYEIELEGSQPRWCDGYHTGSKTPGWTEEDPLDWWEREHLQTVHNIEVEGYNTYYVHSLGIWVHT